MPELVERNPRLSLWYSAFGEANDTGTRSKTTPLCDSVSLRWRQAVFLTVIQTTAHSTDCRTPHVGRMGDTGLDSNGRRPLALYLCRANTITASPRCLNSGTLVLPRELVTWFGPFGAISQGSKPPEDLCCC
jgi:hypothetical protein